MTDTGRTKIKRWGVLAVLLLLTDAHMLHAQFLDLRLDVEARVTAETEQTLDFGTLITNTGRTSIEAGGNEMGVFSITALEDQLLLVSLDLPDRLHHGDSQIADYVPVDLSARYGYTFQGYDHTYPLPQLTTTIKVEENESAGPWSSVYFYLFGSVTVGDIFGGVYANEIVLHVEYL